MPNIRKIAMKPRAWLVKGHRWVAIGLLGWLAVISVTGVVLLVDDQWDHTVHSDWFESGEGDLGLDAAIASAKKQMPKDAELSYATMPSNANGVYFVEFEYIRDGAPKPAEGEDYAEEDHRYLKAYVNPATAEVNKVRAPYAGFEWWMYRGHMHLWQDQGIFAVDAPGGFCDGPKGIARPICTAIPTGDDMVAWFGVGWLVVLATGFYVWYWPGVKRWARIVRVRRGRGRFSFHMDLHKAWGIVLLIPMTVVTWTGIQFAFPLMVNMFDRATPAQEKFDLWVPSDEQSVSAKVAKGTPPIGYDAAIASVREAHPSYEIRSAMPPYEENGTYSFWVTRGFDPWTAEGGGGNTYVFVDQFNGKLTYVGSPEDGNAFDQAWDDWSFPLHTGDFGGWFSRWSWNLVAISPVVLGVTGVVMNQVRKNKRKKHEAPALEEPAPREEQDELVSV